MAREDPNILVSDRSTLGDSSSPEDSRQLIDANRQRSDASIDDLRTSMETMNTTLELILWRVDEGGGRGPPPPAAYSPLTEHHQPPPPPPPPLCHPHPPMAPHAQGPNLVPRYVKLDFSTFDGSKDPLDPLIWLHKCDQFFYHKNTPVDDRIQLAAYHMLDEVLLWFHQFRNEHLVQDWETFRQSCMMRFGPSASSNPLGELINFKQTSPLDVYQKTFQECLARGSNFVRPSQYVQIFTTGLTEALRLEVELHGPRYLDHAMNLARTIDTKQRVLKESLIKKPAWPSRTNATAPSPYSGPPRTGPTAARRAESSSSMPLAPYIKKLNRQEKEQRRAKGLCFNCDDQYVQGHICKKLFSVILCEDSDDILPEEDFVEIDHEGPTISLHAMTGLCSSNTMQVWAQLHLLQLLALVDSGSTHNFISQPAAEQLGLVIQQKTGLSISVANGAKIASVGISTATPFYIEGHSFIADFLVIRLAEFDLVLGVKWLQMLGPTLWDFQALTMTFIEAQRQITLHGTHATVPCTLQAVQVQSTELCKLSQLLTEFEDLFQAPSALPPIGHCDHRIRLQMGTKLVVVQPYRYSHLQKDEIEHQCENKLVQGIIQPKRSPFSSLVLLVKKHDKSWKFCVDYRQLNAHSIKDKFPILVVDERLDELHGTTIFTKLDMKSGYHHI
ncbi:uncharacterized protein [Aristolochia californica]|uniref:uncharacterized protein n=1 Tax=Aristolochia californica TaxID=171875 RepID=UPI0035DF12B4